MQVSPPPQSPEADSAAIPARWAWVLAICLGALTFQSAFFHVVDPDVGYHIRTGMLILETGRIPDRNTFSFAVPDHPWTLQQWWPATAYAIAWMQGGLGGLIGLKAMIVTAMMLVVLAAARRETGLGSLWPFWVVTGTVFVGRVRFFERPDMVTGLLFALLVFIDAGKATGRRWHWIGLPIFMAFWANTHAGYIYGFVLLCCWSGAEWGGWLLQRWHGGQRSIPRALFIRPAGIAVAVALSVASAELINPSGWRALWVPIDQFLDPFWRSVITEYLPPSWEKMKPFYIWLASLAALQMADWRRVQLRLLLPSLAFGYLACATQRSMLVFLLAATPHAAFLLGQLAPGATGLLRRVQWGLMAPVWLAAAVCFSRDSWSKPGVGLHLTFFPMSVYHFLDREVAPQRLFNEMRFGGSMLWWLWPKFPPFVDGRGDAYPTSFWKDEFLPILYAAPGWKEKLAAHDIHGVLLPIIDGQAPMLAKALRTDPQWALVSFTDSALLMLERTEANRAVIARHEFRHLWPVDWTATSAMPVDAASLAEAERAVALAPESVFAQTAVARAAMAAGRLDRAAEMLAILTRLPNPHESHWSYYGYALFHLGKLDEAQAVFATMHRRGIAPGYAWFMRHHIALRRGDLAGADRCLTEALRLTPDSGEFNNARARLDARLKSQ